MTPEDLGGEYAKNAARQWSRMSPGAFLLELPAAFRAVATDALADKLGDMPGAQRLGRDPVLYCDEDPTRESQGPLTHMADGTILLEGGTLSLWRGQGRVYPGDIDGIRASPLEFLAALQTEVKAYLANLPHGVQRVGIPELWVARTGPRHFTWSIWGYGALTAQPVPAEGSTDVDNA